MQTIIFSSNDNPQLAEELGKLRHEVFCQKLKWFPENEEGIERDEFDGLDRTRYVVIKKKDQIVAFVRLIYGSPSLTEKLAGESFHSTNHLCVSRMYFRKGHNDVRTALEMIGAIISVGVVFDAEYYIGCTYTDFVKKQIPVPLPFPIWKKKNIDGFPSIFYKSKARALSFFYKLIFNA